MDRDRNPDGERLLESGAVDAVLTMAPDPKTNGGLCRCW